MRAIKAVLFILLLPWETLNISTYTSSGAKKSHGADPHRSRTYRSPECRDAEMENQHVGQVLIRTMHFQRCGAH